MPESTENQDHLQRDKEMRSKILDTLFGRLVWIDAGALAALLLAITRTPPVVTPTIAMISALLLFCASLLLALVSHYLRHLGSFRRDKFNVPYQVVTIAAIAGTGLATYLVITEFVGQEYRNMLIQAASIILAVAGTFLLAFSLRIRRLMSSDDLESRAVRDLVSPTDVKQCPLMFVSGLILISLSALLQFVFILAV